MAQRIGPDYQATSRGARTRAYGSLTLSSVPGFAAPSYSREEDAKLDEDFRSASPVSQCHGGRHRLLCLLCLRREGGLETIHALALLSEIAEFGDPQAGKLKAPESWGSSSPNAASAYWVRKWKQEVSGWLQVTMSDTLLRQTCISCLCVWVLISSGP